MYRVQANIGLAHLGDCALDQSLSERVSSDGINTQGHPHHVPDELSSDPLWDEGNG
jgi:hypothetical protein